MVSVIFRDVKQSKKLPDLNLDSSPDPDCARFIISFLETYQSTKNVLVCHRSDDTWWSLPSRSANRLLTRPHVAWKFVHNISSRPLVVLTGGQTDKPTDKPKRKHDLLGADNESFRRFDTVRYWWTDDEIGGWIEESLNDRWVDTVPLLDTVPVAAVPGCHRGGWTDLFTFVRDFIQYAKLRKNIFWTAVTGSNKK